jgi:hypothetical protein
MRSPSKRQHRESPFSSGQFKMALTGTKHPKSGDLNGKRNGKNGLNKKHQNYVNNIVTEGLQRDNKQPFWKYIKAQRQDYFANLS